MPRSPCLRLHPVQYLGQVRDGRARIEFFEHTVPARVAAHLSDLAVRIATVAEHDGLGRAGLGAGRGEFAITRLAVLEPRIVLRGADALDAEGALLHHPACPHRDIGIELQVERLGPRLFVVLVPVEIANLVGAVVAAVPGAHAAVVDLAVQPVHRMVRRKDRAYRLARSVLALLAQHRHEAGLQWIVTLPAFPVALDPHPAHFTPAQDLVLTDGRNIVLRVAGGDTGLSLI